MKWTRYEKAFNTETTKEKGFDTENTENGIAPRIVSVTSIPGFLRVLCVKASFAPANH